MAFPLMQHQCSYRPIENTILRILADYWLLPAHLACSLAVVTMLLTQINGRAFLVATTSSNAPPSVLPIYQTNVTTLLSISIVVVRTLAGAWLTLAGWRLAFIMLEYNGTTLKGFSRLVRYRIPPRDSFSTPLSAILCVIFIISVPVQFISPILTGAVSWIPNLAMSPSQPVNVTHPGDTPGWTYHRDYENSRFYEVMQALAHSSLATTANFSDSSKHISRRRIPSLQDFPANSSVEEVIMPYLNIESLEWLRSPEETLPQIELFKNVTSNEAFKLSVIPSEIKNPYFHGGDPGRVTIAFEEEWSLTGSYPAAKVVRGNHYVIVSTNGRQKCGDPEFDPPFGPLNGLYHLDARTGTSRFNNWHDPSCYVIARMAYSAGIVTCRNCRLSAGGIVETTLQDESVVTADTLAEQALRMMPDVLALMSVSHSWNNWMQPGNLDEYTKGMLSVAYQASWNSMANIWSNDTTMRRTTLSIPFPALTASITIWRVWTWLAMNCLLTISGIIVAILQKQAFAKTVRNPELSLLLLDTKQLIEKSSPGLCNAVKVDKEDTDLRMRLQFQEGHESSHQHPYIEVEKSTYRRLPQDCSYETLAYQPKR